MNTDARTPEMETVIEVAQQDGEVNGYTLPKGYTPPPPPPTPDGGNGPFPGGDGPDHGILLFRPSLFW